MNNFKRKFSLIKGYVKLIYKNMWFRRPKVAVILLILFALWTSYNTYSGMIKFGNDGVALVSLALALSLWFRVLPMIIFIIDCSNKNDIDVLNRIALTIPEFYDITFTRLEKE